MDVNSGGNRKSEIMGTPREKGTIGINGTILGLGGISVEKASAYRHQHLGHGMR